MGQLIGIARATKVRGDMEVLDETSVSVEAGVDQDRRGAVKGAQVTVLAREDWEAACADLDVILPWTMRRANLYVEGVSLPREVGAKVRVGSVVLVVREETNPCSVMEKAQAGLRDALTPDWRGGIRCDVLESGAIRIGDAAETL
jgi:MOSC domain-containing protein YiiM